MKRYFYEGRTKFAASKDYGFNRLDPVNGYHIFDRLRGYEHPIALAWDRDDAEKVADALNATV